MASQTGITPFQGSVGELTGYKVKGLPGTFIRKKTGPSKSQILNDPAFARTRENMSEFGGIAKINQQLRKPLLATKSGWDRGLQGRATKALRKVLLLDTAAPRGQRSIQITQYGGPLQNLEFNAGNHFGTAFKAPYTVSTDAGRAGATFATPVINAAATVETPPGATHFRIGLHLAALSDYYYNATDKTYGPSGGGNLNGLSVSAYTDYQDAVNASLPAITLHAPLPQTGTPPAPPTLTPDVSLIVCVGIQFFQLAGGIYYPFEQNAALHIEQIVTH